MHVSLREGIDWVGYVDWTVRDFHSYNTERGTTYNAYLIRDEQVALIDTVKEPFGNDLLANVSALVDPAKVDWVVCNHAEPDHSGVLPQVLAAMPNATRCRPCKELDDDGRWGPTPYKDHIQLSEPLKLMARKALA